jgi:amidase
LSDPSCIAAKNEALVSTKAAVMALFAKYQLDAIVYPTLPRPAQYIKPDGLPAPSDSPTNLANESGFPDLIVPAGMTWSGLPVIAAPRPCFALLFSVRSPSLLAIDPHQRRALNVF